jgi:hypothetical protein
LSGCFLSVLLLTGTLTSGLAANPVAAEIRIVTAGAEHRMGSLDTREDAIRLAVEAAKKAALELVATYLESVTVVVDLDVTKDEIRSYSAGMVTVLNQEVTTRLEGDTVVIRVDLTTQVDSDEVAQAITALRKNEEAQRELVSRRNEADFLDQQLAHANRALEKALTLEQLEAAKLERLQALNQIKAHSRGSLERDAELLMLDIAWAHIVQSWMRHNQRRQEGR